MDNDIFSAYLVAIVLGNISQNKSSRSVITHVEIHIARLCSIHDDCAISRLILVANDAVKTLTKLFPIKMVMSSFSFLALSFWSILAPGFFCLTKASILCAGNDMKAISLPEKNADKPKNNIKIKIDADSIVI